MRGVVPISPRQIDPLSWITGPLVPLVFAGLSTAYAIRGVLVDLGHEAIWLQFVAAALFTVALVLLHLASRGLRGSIAVPEAVAAIAIGVAALILSAVGYAGETFMVEAWWAPMSLALIFGALAPYFAATRIVAICGVATLIAVPTATAIVAPALTRWGPVSVATIVSVPLLSGVVLSALFSGYVVERMRALLEARSRTVIVAGGRGDEVSETAERIRLAQLTARAVPFLEEIAHTGRITATERWLAGQLARRLRDDLVTQTEASWLERLDGGSRLVVIDPERRADGLRPPQRTALRGLIRALLSAPGVDSTSLLVELRSRPDGATAVGVSMDAELPEGRRVMHLAPYLFTVEMTSEELTWQNDDFLRMTFAFPEEVTGVPAAPTGVQRLLRLVGARRD